MSARILFADPESARDALAFAGRAQRIGDEGVRLQAAGGVMTLTTAVLAPHTLFDATPTVLAMRVAAVDPELRCDLVVAELFASDDPRALTLPETGLSPSWAGISPPRGGWAPRSEIAASALALRAQWGISAVAYGAPTGSGEEAVRTLRAEIWGAPDEDIDGLPRGMAFAAEAMGFIEGQEQARVTVAERWTRLTLRRGHVLSRGPVAVGLTPVRATGRAPRA